MMKEEKEIFLLPGKGGVIIIIMTIIIITQIYLIYIYVFRFIYNLF